MKYYIVRFYTNKDGEDKIGTIMPKDTRKEALSKFYRNLVEDMDDKSKLKGRVVMFNETMAVEKMEDWESDVVVQTPVVENPIKEETTEEVSE